MDDESLKILKDIVEYGFVIHDGGGLLCFFCGVGDGTPHESNCLWLKAQVHLAGRGIEVKDSV